MNISNHKVTPLPDSATHGEALQPHAYNNPELLNQELEEFFLKNWQFAGHENDIPNAGDYLNFEMANNSIILVRGEDQQIRAFQNVCRHRASRLLEGESGHCNKVIQCPYHGWAYNLDGGLRGVPSMDSFPPIDKANMGLREVGLESMEGLLFVKIINAPGLGVAEAFGDSIEYVRAYDLENYHQIAEPIDEIWNVNWKVAWDNYQENYHIPVGHPGLNRMLDIPEDEQSYSSGVSYSVFPLSKELSSVALEASYQKLAHVAEHRVPEKLRGQWFQVGYPNNLGMDFYPEMLDLFQLIPLAVDKTLVRATFYGPKDCSEDELELRRINIAINTQVNDEDKTLCERVQKGLQQSNYAPGPLSLNESAVAFFHDSVREKIPGAR
ncbi:MAG: aromatic ring-hydroxylating dioxygenase subunit alpha [Pseudomonadales bacterium]